MKAGDEDEKRYTEAVKSYHDRDGSCRPVAGASAKVTKQLSPSAPSADKPSGRCSPPPRTVWRTGRSTSLR